MENDDDNADVCDETFESVKEEAILESSVDSVEAEHVTFERGDDSLGGNQDAFSKSNPDSFRRNDDDQELVIIPVKERRSSKTVKGYSDRDGLKIIHIADKQSNTVYSTRSRHI